MINSDFLGKTTVVVLIFLLVVVTSFVFIGGGFLLTLLFGLTLFESAFLFMSTTLILLFVIFMVRTDSHLERIVEYLNGEDGSYYFEDTEDGEEDEETDFESQIKQEGIKSFKQALDLEFDIVDKRKIGRNGPCPCGSGKKYKFCCGKQH